MPRDHSWLRFEIADYLIAEAVLQWGREQQEALRSAPPAAAGPLDRVIETLRRVLDDVEQDPNLFQAAVMAFVSPDLGVGEMQRQLSDLVANYLEVALEQHDACDLEPMSMVLSHVFFSSIVNMTAGRTTPGQVIRDLEITARMILERR